MDGKKRLYSAVWFRILLCLAASGILTVFLAATVLRPLFYTRNFQDVTLTITNLGIQNPESEEEEPGTAVEIKTIQGVDCSLIPETEGWHVEGSWIVSSRTEVPSSISIPVQDCRYIMAIFVCQSSGGKIELQVGNQKEELDLYSPGYERIMWNYQTPQTWSLKENPQDVAALFGLCAAVLLGAYFFWERSRDAAIAFQSLYHLGFFVIFALITKGVMKNKVGDPKMFYPILALFLGVHLLLAFLCGKTKKQAALGEGKKETEAPAAGESGLETVEGKGKASILGKIHLTVWDVCFGGGLFLMLLVQIYMARQLAVEPGWDFGNVYYGAREIVATGHPNDYNNCFVQYPNNVFAMMFLAAAFKVVSLFQEVTVFTGIWINIVLIDLAVFLLYLWMRSLWTPGKAFYGAVLSFFMCPYYLFVPIFYTDTMALPFTSGMLCLSLWAQRREDRKGAAIRYGILGVFCILGYLMKGNLMVFTIAIGINIVLRGITKAVKKEETRKRAVVRTAGNLGGLVIGAAAMLLIWKIGIPATNIINYEERERLEFPAEHWLMVGVRENAGGWSGSDSSLAGETDTIAQRKQVCGQMIYNRVRAMGFYNMEKFFIQKGIVITWGDGLYFTYEKLKRDPYYESWLHDYVLQSGSHFGELSLWASGYHVAMLLLMLVSIFGGIWSGQVDQEAMVRLMVLGLMLFLSIWESRSRYLVNATPLFIIMAVDGSTKITGAARKLFGSRNSGF